ncbi:MAG TPA: hypothetical protein VE243_03460 [Candidatus Acidoferrum sp.]|nr:hypothetical protein [Candidatus Acidoferrum sp.]
MSVGIGEGTHGGQEPQVTAPPTTSTSTNWLSTLELLASMQAHPATPVV